MNLTIKNYYGRWSKNLFILLLFFLILMSLARVLFAWFFGNVTEITSDLPLLRKVLVLGIRYDLILLSYLNVFPFVLLNLSYFTSRKSVVRPVRKCIIIFLALGYFAIFWLLVSDFAFYSYFQDRLNPLFFGLFEDDTWALMISIWKNYSVPLWLFLFTAFHWLFYRLIKIMFSSFEFDLKTSHRNWRMAVTSLLGILFFIFGARGSLSLRPLSTEDAIVGQDKFLNILSLNGAITLNRALKLRRSLAGDQADVLRQYHFSSWQQALQITHGKKAISTDLMTSLKHQTDLRPALAANPPHVVMIISEGMGSYWNDLDSKNFNILGSLKPHFTQDILFKNFLPADNGTIGSFNSIAFSQVMRPGSVSLAKSSVQELQASVHRPYHEAGYETHFVYGGKLGWRNIGPFLKLQGYQKVWGEDEIKGVNQELRIIDPRNLGNEWGLFDEYLYSFIEERLRTAVKPQFFLVLTTANHPPFEVPLTYRPHPLELPEEITKNIAANLELTKKRFLSLQYANQKVGDFLSRLKRSRLKDNTIVGLTGDHSYWVARGVGYEKEFKHFAVPFYIMTPEHLRQRYDPDKFGSHEDIFPTLYHLSLSGGNYLKLGRNLFQEESYAINASGLVANKSGAYHNNRYWRWKNLKDQLLEPTDENPELLKLKRYSEAMIAITSLYLKEEKKRKPPVLTSDPPE